MCPWSMVDGRSISPMLTFQRMISNRESTSSRTLYLDSKPVLVGNAIPISRELCELASYWPCSIQSQREACLWMQGSLQRTGIYWERKQSLGCAGLKRLFTSMIRWEATRTYPGDPRFEDAQPMQHTTCVWVRKGRKSTEEKRNPDVLSSCNRDSRLILRKLMRLRRSVASEPKKRNCRRGKGTGRYRHC